MPNIETLKVDADRLVPLIETGIERVRHGDVENRFCIGVFGRIQVQLVVTRDQEWGVIEDPSLNHICLSV